ncbi:MAG: tRNA (adenosine(37)-N6)-threonylcarbamoyltransferase complex ATPase subunit type 1 TsaE [Candidatus Peribacteria bacterium]|nr:tRNA (adenosine(37)-N6)-threonylcarbamoyltransferase complex ATPase subunit type 1 TsaE [Candidatus Peribacteria bacterium]
MNPEQVQSPTYTYLNIYDNKLLHLDMYRLKSFEEMVEKGIIDQMNDFDYILIERPKWKEQLDL